MTYGDLVRLCNRRCRPLPVTDREYLEISRICYRELLDPCTDVSHIDVSVSCCPVGIIHITVQHRPDEPPGYVDNIWLHPVKRELKRDIFAEWEHRATGADY